MAGTSLILLVWRSEEDKESFPLSSVTTALRS